MAHGTHDYDIDPRNASIVIGINDDLLPREQAVVSVFDSGFMLGDGVWEGIRVHHGRMAFLDEHLRRLYEGAKGIDMDIGRSPRRTDADDPGDARRQRDGRGRRCPHPADDHPWRQVDAVSGSALHDLATDDRDHSRVQDRPTRDAHRGGPAVHGVDPSGRPDVQDPKWNSHSKLNCISACIQAAKAGADEGLMLDPQGFVATCNSTHFFIVRHPDGPDGPPEVWTSTGDYCMPGITRRNVLRLCAAHGVTAREKNFSVTECYGATEAFVTGTFAGIAPVTEIDGRTIGTGARGPMVEQLQQWYVELLDQECG